MGTDAMWAIGMEGSWHEPVGCMVVHMVVTWSREVGALRGAVRTVRCIAWCNR